MANKKLLVLAAFAVLLVAAPAFSQEVSGEGFVGLGIAKIVDGDIAASRQKAFADAQEKVVMAAVCAQLPIETMETYFLTLRNIFFGRPDIYLQRFKILSENALFDRYQVTIQGFVQADLLREDLESMGVVGPKREKVRVLLMIAEKDLDQPDETFWWSSEEGSVSSRAGVQQKLEKRFTEKGSSIVNPFETSGNVFLKEIGGNPEPDIEEICRVASALNARIVVQGKSSLQRAAGQKQGSFVSIQCDMSATVIDVRKKAVIVQAATYTLGIHIDEPSAVQDAVEKACSHISEQIIDKIYLQMRSVNEYTFKLTFKQPETEAELQGFFTAFESSFPEIEFFEIKSGDAENTWSLSASSSVESAALLQKLYDTGIKGYKTEVVSVDENKIELKVAAAKDQEPKNTAP